MTESVSAQLKKARSSLGTCKRKLKEAEEMNERLRALVGNEELGGWKPQKQVERMYGWVHAWLYPLSSYMNQNLSEPLTPSVRNKIHDIAMAIIAQLAVHGKYGVKLPHDPRAVDLEAFQDKQARIFRKEYEPCAICGEDRITHECHIIPRAEGGPLHRDNMVMLCPLHHHLFDQSRLSEDEWQIFTSKLDGKMDAAIHYANQVCLPLLVKFWKSSGAS